MSNDEQASTQIVWSPDDLPAAEAEALQALMKTYGVEVTPVDLP